MWKCMKACIRAEKYGTVHKSIQKCVKACKKSAKKCTIACETVQKLLLLLFATLLKFFMMTEHMNCIYRFRVGLKLSLEE